MDAAWLEEWDQLQGNQEAYDARANKNSKTINLALQQNLLAQENIIDIFNFDLFHQRLAELTETFHEDFFTHALAVKTQAITGILAYACKNFGKRVGCEGASFCEVSHGRKIGFAPENIIYDSPVKPPCDLEKAIQQGFHMNLDNLDDIKAVQEILARHPESKSTIGLRINPVVGTGTIAALSTAGIGSKFGLIYNDETKDQIFGYFKDFKFLTGLHVHVGSQGCGLKMLVHGAKTVLEAAQEINQKLDNDQIKILDIGGGLPTCYKTDNDAFKFADYRKALEADCPDLFSGKFRIITEFGRSVFTKCGITVTKIFSIKKSDPNGELIDQLRAKNNLNPIAFSYVGSNSFVREAYQPVSWRRRFTLYSPDGASKNDLQNGQKYDIAGPLCFQGDYLAKDVRLPSMEKHDLLVMHDTGGYTMSMYSKYNSLQAQSVYGFSEKGGFKMLRPRETEEQVLSFWGDYE